MRPKPARSSGGASSSERLPLLSGGSSGGSKHHQHAPLAPSQLRESHILRLSSEDTNSKRADESATPFSAESQRISHESEVGWERISPSAPDYASVASNHSEPAIEPAIDADLGLRVRARLLAHKDWDRASGCGSENCNHGTFSPRPGTHRTYGSIRSDISQDGIGGSYPGGSASPSGENVTQALLGETVTDGLLGGGKGSQKTTTRYLAERHGIKHTRSMYLAYYIPIMNWAKQYKWSYLRGDLIAAITMASFYIPMSLSLASNLGHIPAINGLYSFVFNPIIYAILGTCPQMVVGPEAAGSLLTGEVVRENIEKRKTGELDGRENAEIAGVVTCMAGGIILAAGLCRLGFLDSVLSRPFLRGFISAIGVVIFVDQLIPEMGLAKRASHVGGVSHGSCLDKVIFLGGNIRRAHVLTSAVSFGAFSIIMAFRSIKKRLQSRYPSVAYFPDRFLVVVLSAVFTWQFEWDKQGLAVLGDVKASDAFNTSLIIALLGFFESSVAAKSLGTVDGRKDRLHNMHLSPNRELVALGVANITGGLFMALPAFGGYGRSKVNASTGGRTPMSSIFLSAITILCVFFLLPYFYYLPKAVLSAMISVVAYSLVEEAPHDIRFFWRIRGWSELILMLLIFVTTVFWDIKKGIAVGMGLSILRVIRHSTRPRIQILGRVLGTTDEFENAETDSGRLEFIEGCLIVKIPEPLTFANTGDLKTRLKRLEEHGTGAAHPALPRVRREENNKNIIFDVHGVTSLDGAGAQVLSEIVQSYRARDVRVFFCRVPGERSAVWRLFETSGIVEMCGGPRHFVRSVEEALRLTELESLSDDLRENGSGSGRL